MLTSYPVLLSTSDLCAVNVRAELRGGAETLSAIAALLPPGSPQRLLLSPREDIKPKDVVLSELLNQRGPAAWLAAAQSCETADAESVDEVAASSLARLALDCIARGVVLVLTTQSTFDFDLVLLPRQAAVDDGITFAAFATRVEGVRFIAHTIAEKKVAVVLDLDSTLLESEHLPLQPPEWRELDWRTLSLRQEPSGQAVMGRVSRLEDEPHHSESVHAATWTWKGFSQNFRVRQRLGWSHLRDLLIQEGHPGGKLTAYVLSLGRPLYIQTCWNILDPHGLIIAPHEFKHKVNSARPDGVSHCPQKTPCVGLGLRTVFDQDYNMQLAPVFIADDCPEVFVDKYRDAVLPVPAYKPVSSQPNDYDADGSVLRNMANSITQFWQHCYGEDGNGGAVAAVARAARRALHQLCAVPLPSEGQAVVDCCTRVFKGQELLSCSLSVRSFLEQQQSAMLLSAVQDAVPAACFVSENDENTPQPKAGILAAPPAPSAASSAAAPAEGRALRPSSRQDNVPPGPAVHLPCKTGAAQQLPPHLQQGAALPSAAPAEVQQACRGGVESALDTISIVPGGMGGGGGSEDGDSHFLVLPLGGVAQQEAGPAEAAEEDSGPAAADACGASISGDCLAACPVELATGGSEAEDEEVVVEPAEGTDDGGALGRKRDFASIAGQDSLLGPAGPGALAAVTII